MSKKAMTSHNELLNTIEQNHLGHFTYLPKILGFDVHQTAGVTVINCGLKTSMFNIAYGAPSDCDLAIDGIKQAYKGQPFAWWIPPSEHNPNTTNALMKKGFIIEAMEQAMICDLNHFGKVNQKTDLMITLVTKPSSLQDFVGILAPYDPHVPAFYELINETLLQTKEQFFVGYAQDKPVSVGILWISKESAGIFTLMTHERSRGLGYGTDMMLFLMKYAKDVGCKSVTLSASSDSGYRLYERLGFIEMGKFECFEYKE